MLLLFFVCFLFFGFLERERQREREERILSRLHTQHEAWHRAWSNDCEITTWAKIKSWRLDHWATQALCYYYFCFLGFFGFFNIYLVLKGRERERESRVGADREGDTESQAGSRLWAVSTEPDAGLKLTNYEIMTWAEVGCLTNWATQAPLLLLFLKWNLIWSSTSGKQFLYSKIRFLGHMGSSVGWASDFGSGHNHGSWAWGLLWIQCPHLSLPLPHLFSLSQNKKISFKK